MEYKIGVLMLEKIWFIILSFLLTGYTVLDGFDLGVGILFPFVAKTEKERSLALQAIGPVWDGNEVWLVAAGGVLFFAFPKAYASAMSGLYLGIFLILWLIILRALAIELRVQLDNPLWRAFWETVFFAASLGLTFLLGSAFGDLLRGFLLDASGHFFLPLWTKLLPRIPLGILDWFTVLIGVLAVSLLSLHGANFLVWKTDGKLQSRAQSLAFRLVWVSGFLILAGLILTPLIQPQIGVRFLQSPWGFIFPILALLAWTLLFLSLRRKKSELMPLVYSKLLIASLLASAFFAIYPNILISVNNPATSLTVLNTAASQYGLKTGLIWFSIGLILLLAYTGYVYKSFWGKVQETGGENY
jgi:cytochrome bd ubiquinol oxidase subunit II